MAERQEEHVKQKERELSEIEQTICLSNDNKQPRESFWYVNITNSMQRIA